MRISERDGVPVICVKDPYHWPTDARTRAAYDVLTEREIEHVYEQAREQFWNDAEMIAYEHGYGPHVYSYGRSSGWLGIDARQTAFLEYLDAKDPWSGDHDTDDAGDPPDPYVVAALLERDRWLKFAHAIDAHIVEAGNYFAELLAECASELKEG